LRVEGSVCHIVISKWQSNENIFMKEKNFKKYFQKRLQTIDIILGFA